jgi:hypothetical protein
MSIYRRTRMLLPATAIAMLAACQPQTVTMTPEETQRVAQLTERMTPRCVGRYLIDLPASFVLNSQWSAVIEGVKINVQPMTKAMFDVSLAAHKSKLSGQTIVGEKTLALTETRSLPSDGGVVFNRSRNGESSVLRAWDAVAWAGGYRISAVVDARDMSKSDGAFKGDTRRTDLEEKFAVLLSVLTRLRGRPETEVPREPGFCIANGFLAGPPSENEESYVSFELAGSPDVWLNVASIPETAKEDTRLLERTAQVERDMMASGTQTIRKGAVMFRGAPFDEWLFKGRTPDRVPGTMFYLLGNESTPGLAHPFIRMQLFNGFRVPAPERTAEQSAQLQDLERASLSEAEAIGVWNKVAATVRLRPGAF